MYNFLIAQEIRNITSVNFLFFTKVKTDNIDEITRKEHHACDVRWTEYSFVLSDYRPEFYVSIRP